MLKTQEVAPIAPSGASVSSNLVGFVRNVLSKCRSGEMKKSTGHAVVAWALKVQRGASSSSDSVYFLMDTGSDAHLSNSRKVFVDGTEHLCDVAVSGVSNSKVLRARVCGDVMYRNVALLKNVLFLPDANLGPSDIPPGSIVVLVSVSLLTQQENCGFLFLPKGEMELMRSKKSESSARISTVAAGLFVDKVEKSKVSVKCSSKATTTEEKEEEGENVNHKPQMTKKQQQLLGKLLHRRLHFGKTSAVVSALRRAYGVALLANDDNDSEAACDACMWSSAKFKPRPRESRRSAVRVGERLHHDLFTSSVRSESGCKYLLVVGNRRV